MSDINDPDERFRTAYMMYDYLSQAPVLLPLADPKPDGGLIIEVPFTPDAAKNLAVSINASNPAHTAMLMFLDAPSLQAKFPGCRFVSQPAKAVLEMFVSSRYDSLFLNPEGQWSSWTREWAAEVLAAGRQGRG